MIGVITTDGIPITLSLKTRIRRSLQNMVFKQSPSTRGADPITNCDLLGALVLESYADMESLSGAAVSSESIINGGYGIDDSKFNSLDLVLLAHGYSCAGRAIHGENFDPWGSLSLARICLNLLTENGLLGVCCGVEGKTLIETDLKAFWPAAPSTVSAEIQQAADFLSCRDWLFLRPLRLPILPRLLDD